MHSFTLFPKLFRSVLAQSLSQMGASMRFGLLGFLLLLNFQLSAQVIPTDSLAANPIGGKNAIKSVGTADTVLIDSPLADSNAILISGDSTATNKLRKDRTKREDGFKLHLSAKKEFYDPNVAVRRSAILPGWGQIYCNRFWKLPIIYGGFGALIAVAVSNHQGYLQYDRAVKCAGTPNLCVPNPYYQWARSYKIDGLISIREQYRRKRDLSIIVCGLWYTLNLVDAYVDSHLRTFNVSDDLSLDLSPSLHLDPFQNRNLVLGGTITLGLRK